MYHARTHALYRQYGMNLSRLIDLASCQHTCPAWSPQVECHGVLRHACGWCRPSSGYISRAHAARHATQSTYASVRMSAWLGPPKMSAREHSKRTRASLTDSRATRGIVQQAWTINTTHRHVGLAFPRSSGCLCHSSADYSFIQPRISAKCAWAAP